MKVMEAITAKLSLSAQPPSIFPHSVDHNISSITKWLFDP